MTVRVAGITISGPVSSYVQQKAREERKNLADVIGDLLQMWYEEEIRRLHDKYLRGDITLRGMARKLGVDYRELYQLLEERGLAL